MRCHADWIRRPSGFSLIEMLVALAVFSLVVLGLLNLAGENTRTAVVIEERVLAGVVAENRAVEAMTSEPAALLAQASGTEVAGDRTWRWKRQTSRTDNAAIARIEITVMPETGDRIAAEASLFRALP